MKVVVNTWLTGLVETLAETVALAEALGVDPADFIDIIEGGPLFAPYVKLKGTAMVEGRLRPELRAQARPQGRAPVAGGQRPRPAARAGGRRPVRARVEAGHGDEDMSATVARCPGLSSPRPAPGRRRRARAGRHRGGRPGRVRAAGAARPRLGQRGKRFQLDRGRRATCAICLTRAFAFVRNVASERCDEESRHVAPHLPDLPPHDLGFGRRIRASSRAPAACCATAPTARWSCSQRSDDALEPRVGPLPAPDLRAGPAVDHDDVGREVVGAADQRRADAVGVDRHAVGLEARGCASASKPPQTTIRTPLEARRRRARRGPRGRARGATPRGAVRSRARMSASASDVSRRTAHSSLAERVARPRSRSRRSRCRSRPAP